MLKIKLFITIFAGMFLFEYNVFSQNVYHSIPLKSLENSIILEGIKEYSNAKKDIFNDDYGVLVIYLYGEGDSINAYITIEISQSWLLENLPSFYFVFEGVPVLIYTGHEKLFTYDKKSLELFFQSYGSRLYVDDSGITFSPGILKIEIYNGYILKRYFVENIPYSGDPFK